MILEIVLYFILLFVAVWVLGLFGKAFERWVRRVVGH